MIPNKMHTHGSPVKISIHFQTTRVLGYIHTSAKDLQSDTLHCTTVPIIRRKLTACVTTTNSEASSAYFNRGHINKTI